MVPPRVGGTSIFGCLRAVMGVAARFAFAGYANHNTIGVDTFTFYEGSMEDRIRQAVTQITGNVSLTDEMDDAAAAILLEWGSTMATHLVHASADQPPEQAEQYMEANMPNLRRVMRRINGTIGSLSYESPEEIAERLSGLFEAAQQTPPLTDCEVPGEMSLVAFGLKQKSQTDAVTAILRLLTPGYLPDNDE